MNYTISYRGSEPLNEVIKRYRRPDIILMQFPLAYKQLKGFNKIKDIPKVHIMGDYRGHTISTYDNFFKRYKFDLALSNDTRILNILRSKKDIIPNVEFLPWSIDTYTYKKINIPKEIDVMSVFAARPDLYPLRSEIKQMLKKMDITIRTKRVIFWDYVDCINKSKIFVTKISKWKNVEMRYFEILACGTMLLTDKPNDLELYGFEDGKHLVLYDGTLEDLKGKILYYLEHDEEREQIARQGMDFVRQYYSDERIINKKLTKIMENVCLNG
jgi:spore maturation protein CgeB